MNHSLKLLTGILRHCRLSLRHPFPQPAKDLGTAMPSGEVREIRLDLLLRIPQLILIRPLRGEARRQAR